MILDFRKKLREWSMWYKLTIQRSNLNDIEQCNIGVTFNRCNLIPPHIYIYIYFSLNNMLKSIWAFIKHFLKFRNLGMFYQLFKKKILLPFLFKCHSSAYFLFLFNRRFDILRIWFINYTVYQLLLFF